MISRLVRLLLVPLIFGGAMLSSGSAVAQDKKAQWWSNLEACSFENQPPCHKAVELAAELFGRTDRDVATTWMKVCMAGDSDRCEIGYRRFRTTSFEEDGRPISHMFARISCFAGMYDLCRPWDDFETTDPGKRALVMADVCLQGASPNTCWQALGYYRNQKGYHNAITYDLSRTLCERYGAGSACRAWAEALEANWDHRRAYKFHKMSCESGLQESCPDAARLKRRVDYENRQAQAKLEADLRRQAAAQRTTSWRAQANNNGYTSTTGQMRTPTTPFGSSSRDVENWRRYERNLCLGNPVNKYC